MLFLATLINIAIANSYSFTYRVYYFFWPVYNFVSGPMTLYTYLQMIYNEFVVCRKLSLCFQTNNHNSCIKID